MNSLKDLSDRIRKNTLGKKEGFLEPFFKELEEVEIAKFITYNFQHFSDSYVFDLMLELKPYLERLHLSDFQKVLEGLKPNFFPLISFISFTYKFIGIDLVASSSFKGQEKEKIIEYLSKRLGYIQNSQNEVRLLEWHGLDRSSFVNLREKLAIEGGVTSNPKFVELKVLDRWYFDPETGNYKPSS